MKAHVRFGIELETSLKSRVDIQSYHSERDSSKNWYFESDASIESSSEYPNTAELITRPFTRDEFSQLFGDIEPVLKKGFEFNDSTGAHIHVSIENGIKIHDVFTFAYSRAVRMAIYRVMRRHLTASDYKAWMSRVYRDYAKRQKDFLSTGEKYVGIRRHPIGTLELRFFHLFPLRDDVQKVKAILSDVLKAVENVTLDAYTSPKIAKTAFNSPRLERASVMFARYRASEPLFRTATVEIVGDIERDIFELEPTRVYTLDEPMPETISRNLLANIANNRNNRIFRVGDTCATMTSQ